MHKCEKCVQQACKHERVEYCESCGKVYCSSCGKEWSRTCSQLIEQYRQYDPWNRKS
jgi:hypothetical protein